MKKITAMFLAFLIILTAVTGCTNKNVYMSSDTVSQSTASQYSASQGTNTPVPAAESSSSTASASPAMVSQPAQQVIDYAKIKPNECGQIMVVMFHNFVETYSQGKNEFTTTFVEFEKLLGELFDKNYRLISLTDMLTNNINVPAGCIPIVFTFDDGTAGEFNLLDNQGKLKVNPKSAVGIMEAFQQKHPDFGLEGTFFVNLGVKTFNGAGSTAERLNYLIGKGFEIGNHTKTHVSLPDVKTTEKMLEEVGGNQKLMEELVPGYKFNSFSLPFGNASKDLKEYVIQGTYEGVEYKHTAIMLVGANPAPSPVSVKFNPLAIPRVRSTGMTKVECDLDWWLKELQKGSSQYISDGNAETVTVPLAKQQNIDMSKLNGKQLITY